MLMILGRTCIGDFEKIHDPTKHLSPELATVYWQDVHCELASSKSQLRALLPYVWHHCLYIRDSTFLFSPSLSGASLKEPVHKS